MKFQISVYIIQFYWITCPFMCVLSRADFMLSAELGSCDREHVAC
jgi:hypothetical protein